jgi:hypothetical protein
MIKEFVQVLKSMTNKLIQSWEVGSLTVNFKAVLFILHNSNDFVWGLFWMSDLQEWMVMLTIDLAILAQVKISTHGAFVSHSLNG